MFKSADGYELKVGDQVWEFDMQELDNPWTVKAILEDGNAHVDDAIGFKNGTRIEKPFYYPISCLYKHKESVIVKFHDQLHDEISVIENNFEDVLKYRCLHQDRIDKSWTRCIKPSEWLRSTQFSGKHPYCDEHAKLQSDFGKDDPSYFYWVSVEDYKKSLEKKAKKK
jgi:hypothetical protein